MIECLGILSLLVPAEVFYTTEVHEFVFIKVDKSFVSEMEASKEGLSIVQNIIALAHTLNLKVIAEGVETENQFNLLSSIGCDYFQGWYCGRPGSFICRGVPIGA